MNNRILAIVTVVSYAALQGAAKFVTGHTADFEAIGVGEHVLNLISGGLNDVGDIVGLLGLSFGIVTKLPQIGKKDAPTAEL